MKIRPVGAELFCADGWTDSDNEANSHFSPFSETPKNVPRLLVIICKAQSILYSACRSFSVRSIEARVATAVRLHVVRPIPCGQRVEGQKGKHKKILLFTSTWTASQVYDTGRTFSTLQGMGFQHFLWGNPAREWITKGVPNLNSLTLRRLMSYIYIYIYIWSTHSWYF